MPRLSSPLLVGRVAELEGLRRAVQALPAKGPQLMLLAGDAGIGKTRLLGELAYEVRAEGRVVLAGSCVQVGETQFPYGPFVQAFRSVASELHPGEVARLRHWRGPEIGRLVPEFGTGSPQSTIDEFAQVRLFEGVLALLTAVSRRGALVVVLEDLHWADSASLELLRYLAHNMGDQPILIVGSYRSDELHRRHPLLPWLAGMRRLSRVEDMSIGPLTQQEVGLQIAAVSGRPPGSAELNRVYQRTQGNAFYVEELLASGSDTGQLPDTLREILLARLVVLSPASRRIVDLAAAAGHWVSHALLATVAGLSDEDLIRALENAVTAGVLIADESGYAPRHALLQEAIHNDLLPRRRVDLHRRYATVLTAHPELSPPDPASAAAEVAEHWFLARDLDRAFPAAITAARAMMKVFAFSQALRQFSVALELWTPEREDSTGLRRRDLLRAAAEAAGLSGDRRRAAALIQEALLELQSHERILSSELHDALHMYVSVPGEAAAADESIRTAVEVLPDDAPAALRARVLANYAFFLLDSRGESGAARETAEIALAAAIESGDMAARARALCTLGYADFADADYSNGVATLTRAFDAALESPDHHSLMMTGMVLAWGLSEMSRSADGLGVLARCEDALRARGGMDRYGRDIAGRRARLNFWLGRWRESREVAEALIDSDHDDVASFEARAFLVRLGGAEGRFRDAARHMAALSNRYAGRTDVGETRNLARLRAELHLAKGDLFQAREASLTALQSVEPDEDEPDIYLRALRIEAAFAESAVASEDRAALMDAQSTGDVLARRMLNVSERVLRDATGRDPVIRAETAQAQAEHSRIQGESDPHLWSEVVQLRRALDRPYEVAYALYRWGEALVRQEAPSDRVAVPLKDGYEIASRLGAAPLQRAIRGVALAAGLTLRSRAQRASTGARPANGLAALTDRESTVLSLVAAGRSNRQIGAELSITERTAGVHVSNILAKLQVRSRTEAAAVLTGTALTDPRLSAP